MPTLDLGAPSATQQRFLTANQRYVFFGGARGGGKSWAVRTKAVLLCLAYAGIKVMVVRRTYPELRENHILPLCEMLHCRDTIRSNRIAEYNDSTKVITFRNGSRIMFRYCANANDTLNFQGLEVDILFVDEATHQTEEAYKRLTACVRGVNGMPKRVFLTCNPGGVGHGWVKRLAVDRKFAEGENPDDYAPMIKSLVTDNTALMESDPNYIRQLEALPPKLRKAWLEGEWDIFEGQFFEDFCDAPDHYADRRYTNVIAPFEIPDHWIIYRGLDWGYNKPFSVGWFAVDDEGVIYHILELYGCTDTPNEGVKWTPQHLFAEVHRIETEHRWLQGKRIIGICDPACYDSQYGESIVDVAAKYQVYFQPGDHKRIPGWMQCHYRLSFDERGYPMFYVFNNCKGFIRTIPTLQYDEHRPEDIDSSMEDHIADMWRYILMSRPIKPRMSAPSDEYTTKNPASLFLDIPKEDIKSSASRPRMEIIGGD